MSRKTQITLTDRQHAFLNEEADRTCLSVAELIRRAVDVVYRPEQAPRARGVYVSISVDERPDEAYIGRRRGRHIGEIVDR